MDSASPTLLPRSEVALRLGYRSEDTVTKLVSSGRLSAVRFGKRLMVDEAELNAFIAKSRFRIVNGIPSSVR